MKWQLMTCAAPLEDEMNKQDWNNPERLFILNYKQKLINYSPCLSHTAGTFISLFFPLGGMFGGVSMLENYSFAGGGGEGKKKTALTLSQGV